MPFVALHVLGGARYRDLIELFLDADAGEFPAIAEVAGFLRDKALAIQEGDFEYCLARQFMNSYWKPDEVMAMRIVTEGRLPAFYEESGRLLRRFLAGGALPVPDALLSDALALNLALLKQPNRRDDVTVALSADLIGLWRGAVLGQKRVLAPEPTEVVVLRSRRIWETIDDWCREVVWYGNRTGSYFHDFEVRSAT